MELLAELISALVEFLIDLFVQIVAGALMEGSVEVLKRRVLKTDQPEHPGAQVVAYLLFGATAGFLSLHWFPVRFARSPLGRAVVVALAPALSAATIWVVLAALGRSPLPGMRQRRFWFIYAFGLAFALARAIGR